MNALCFLFENVCVYVIIFLNSGYKRLCLQFCLKRKGLSMKKRISLFAALSLVMSMFFGMGVFAQGHITLSATRLTLKQGEEVTINGSSDAGMFCYDDGSAPGTFVDAQPQGAGSYLITISIGNTEPAGVVHFGFYTADNTDGDAADLWVDVVNNPTNSNGSYTNNNGNVMNANNNNQNNNSNDGDSYLDSVKKLFPYGFEFITCSNLSQAIVVCDSTKKLATLYQSGVPYGKYMVKDANGMAYMQTFTQPVGYLGQIYIGVNVPNVYGMPLTLAISPTDKAQFLARGIYGVFLNGTYVPWP